MSIAMYVKASEACGNVKVILLALLLTIIPAIGTAEIIWAGDYETGNFLQWHLRSQLNHPQFAQVPAYGRPVAPNPSVGTASPSYYGDGSLLELVTDPVRNGRYAAKFTVKNSANAFEVRDCDNGTCYRRRTELVMHLVLQPVYNGMPYMSERWVSISHYLPSDWDSVNGNGWGPLVFQLKSPSTNEISPMFAIIVKNNGWVISHRWSHVNNPNSFDVDVLPWQYQMFYDSEYPTSSNWPDGLSDFPDVSASQAALADLNKGGWTDWVMRIRFDGRGSAEGGTGFLTVWKRAGSGPWIKVLHIIPKRTTRGGMTFDHGIGYKVPSSGFGPSAGLYMEKGQVWGLPNNRVLYNDNLKVGSITASFADMSPDGSSADSSAQQSKPMPPTLVSAQ